MSENDKICRACLAAVGPYYYVLFENVSAYMFWFCTSIQIAETESMPKALCTACYELLSQFAEFKQKCIESQNSLLNFKNVKSESDSTETCKFGIEGQNPDYKQQLALKIENQCDDKFHEDSVKYEDFMDNQDHNFISDDDQRIEEKNTHQNNEHANILEKTKIDCELCNKQFLTQKGYENHKKTHQKGTLMLCIQCNKTFRTKQGFKVHQKSIHSEHTFNDTKCKFCGKVFKSVSSLKQHETRHGTRKLYVCDVCGKTCLSKSYLKIHLDTHNGNKERNFACDICNKKFFTKVYLQSHIHRSHSGRQFICQICNITYKYKDNLIKHLLTHEGKKLFKCEYCNKEFSTRTYCIEHQRIHSGERPFSCIYCPKSFMTKRHLSDHHKIHTGERKHKCTVCEQSFTQRGTLKRHMKIHNKVPIGC